MLQTTLPLNSTLQRMTDKARQRNYTYCEAYLIRSSARHRHIGCDVIEKLRPVEEQFSRKAVESAELSASVKSDVSLQEILCESGLLVLRQASFAMAADETSELCNALQSIQPIYLEAEEIDVASVRSYFRHLRNLVREHIKGYASQRFDAYLVVADEFLSQTVLTRTHREEILERTNQRYSVHHPSVSSFPDQITKIVYSVLELAALQALPDGHGRLFRFGRSVYDAKRSIGAENVSLSQYFDFLRQATKDTVRGLERASIEVALEHVCDFLLTVDEVHSHRDSILGPVLKRAKLEAESITSHLQQILEAVLFGSIEGGQDYMTLQLEEIAAKMHKEQCPVSTVAEALHGVRRAVESRLSPRALLVIQEPLEAAAQYFVQIAEMSVSNQAMLQAIADQLEEKFQSFFSRHIGAKSYVTRDQEQYLYNAALSQLPYSGAIMIGRYQATGEFFAEYGFNEEMMLLSLELLENSIRKSFSGQTLGRMLPTWKKIRQHLECSCIIAKNYETIINESVNAVIQKHGSGFSDSEEARESVRREVLMILQTSMVSIIPGGTDTLRMGVAHLIERNVESETSSAIVETIYDSLVQALKKHLIPNQHQRLIPILERIRDTLKAASIIGPSVEETVKQLVEAHAESAHESVREQLRQDFQNLIFRTLLAPTPGGDDWLESHVSIMMKRAQVSSSYASSLHSAVVDLKKRFHRSLDRKTAPAFEDRLARIAESFDLLAEVQTAGSKVTSVAVEKIAVGHQPYFAELVDRSMECAIVSGVVGSHSSVRRFARLALFSAKERNIDAASIHSAYSDMISEISRSLSRSNRKALVPRLESIRDYLTIAAELGANEQTILNESLELLNPQESAEADRDDKVLLLRGSAMALLPECHQDQDLARDVIRYRSSNSNSDSVRSAGSSLKKSVSVHIKAGPVNDFARKVEETAELAAR